MKYILIIFSVLFLYGCNQAPEKKIPGVPYNPEDYYHTQIVTVAGSPVDTTKVLMTANDNKKNWLCEFYVNRITLFTRDYKDTFSISNDCSYSLKNNILLNPFKLVTQDKSFSIEILPETCGGSTSDDSVYSYSSKKIIIVYNKTTLKGCVSIADSTSKH